MDRDELEFLISQHFDGTLDEAESVRLRVHLASDPEAQILFDQHKKLDAALRASQSVLAIDESWLSAQIAEHIDETNARPLRIGGGNRSWMAPLAMAATLIIGLTLGVIFLRDDDRPATIAQEHPAPGPQQTTAIVISGPPAEKPHVNGYASVSVGVPANLTPQIVSALYLSRDLSESRVNIRAAGHRSADAFD